MIEPPQTLPGAMVDTASTEMDRVRAVHTASSETCRATAWDVARTMPGPFTVEALGTHGRGFGEHSQVMVCLVWGAELKKLQRGCDI